MFRVNFFLSILSTGLFFISNSASIFEGFENDKSCIPIQNISSTKSVVVKKNYSLTVMIWDLHAERWETSFGPQYNKTIDANSGTVKNLEFCFKNTSRHDSGYYTWKNDQEKTYTFQLQVWYGPTNIVISPKLEEFLTLDENQQQIINCSADCNPSCIISWNKGSDRNITVSTATSSLLLNNVTESDNGNYTCLAENPKNKSHFLSKQFHISVQYGANINPAFETEKAVKEYDSTNISCRVNSYPLSNISWLRANKEVNTIYSAENEVVLHFENISCDDIGVYKCSAFNGIGQNDTKESMLNVFCKPRFINNYFGYALEKRVTTSIGEEIEINVSIQANPTPQVIFNDFEIQTEFLRTSNTTYDVYVKKLVSSDNDFRDHILIISNSQGNVTIIIKAEKKRRKSGIIYGLIIGGTHLIAFILISVLVLIFTLNKRRQHHKDNLANSNSANNDETGGYRDNILYQSIDTISLQATDQSFDVSNSDSFDSQVSLSIQNLNGCPEKDEEKERNKIKEDGLNTKQNPNIKMNNTYDKIKGRKPVPRPRKTKPFTRNSNEMQPQTIKETSKSAMSKKELACKAVEAEKKSSLSLNSDDDSNSSVSDEKQFCPSYGSYRIHVATSAKKIIKRNEDDESLMDPYKGSENTAKFPGLLSNYLQTNIEQDKQHTQRMHTLKPFNVSIEFGCESQTGLQDGYEYTESEHVADYENVSCDGYTTKNEDYPCQFHDYMNI